MLMQGYLLGVWMHGADRSGQRMFCPQGRVILARCRSKVHLHDCASQYANAPQADTHHAVFWSEECRLHIRLPSVP